MSSLYCHIIYGQEIFPYNLIFSQRKTLAIIVYPNKSIVVKAPFGATLAKIQTKVKKRITWIKKQIRYFEQFELRTHIQSYVSGESHYYLGKKYRLKVILGKSNRVTLESGFLFVTCKDKITPQLTRRNLEEWYLEKTKILFEKLLFQCWRQYSEQRSIKPTLKIQKMKTRWGSLSSKTMTMLLNSELIKAPKECIEYVIIHELCHLQWRHHDSKFYNLLGKILPDWHRRKYKLESFNVI